MNQDNTNHLSADVVLVDYGTANLIAGRLYLNRLFLDYPDLLGEIMVHEAKHVGGNRWSNLIADFREKVNWKLGWVMVTHPSTWCQLSPIWIWRGKIVLSWYMLLYWLLVLLLSTTGVYTIWMMSK